MRLHWHDLNSLPPQQPQPQMEPPELPEVSPWATTTSVPGGGRMSEMSGLLFNTLIIVSIVAAVCLLVYCLCSWCKLLACRFCRFGNDCADEEGSGGGVGGSDDQHRRRRRRSHRSRVSPETPWSTHSSGLYPPPPPSYFESVERLGMPPTPPPGYSPPAAATLPASAAAAAKSAAEEAEIGEVVGLRQAVAGASGHRSCPNVRLVAPAGPNTSGNDA